MDALAKVCGLISLLQCVMMFEVYLDRVTHFKDQLFMVIPLNKEAHAKIFSIDFITPYQFSDKFSKF